MGRGQKPAKGKVEAQLPPARTSRKSKGSKVRDLEKRLAESLEREKATGRALTESLEQQTATGEILRIISESPTAVQPVFDKIVRRAVRLVDGLSGALFRFDGTLIHFTAHDGFTPEGLTTARNAFPLRPTLEIPIGRTILEGSVVHVPDAKAERGLMLQRALGLRSYLSVPMLRDGVCIGGIAVARALEGPFSDRHIELLKTFADQAVIAVENVRLFNETKKALEQQTATAEILSVISQSQTDVQPVFDAILSSALRLMGADAGALTRITGDSLDLAAFKSIDNAGAPPTVRAAFPLSLQSAGSHAKAVRDRAPVNLAEAQVDRDLPEFARAIARDIGYQSMVVVPMLHHGIAIGTISATRLEPGGFTEDEIALLQTFADQAVIAIENVRLFKELEAKNRALTEALEQKTATSDILQTIAQAQTDVQPVFETIVRSAAELCHAHTAAVFLTDGQLVYHPANYGDAPEALAAIKARFPRPLDRETAAGTAILTRSVMHVPDVEEPSAREFVRQTGRRIGFRSLLSVPMLRQGEAVGAINVTRREPGPFSGAEVTLLQTFADQAVIAIENVRLFKELEAANRELAAASQHKSEFLANMSHELRTPLNAIIGFSEVLSDRMFGELNEKQEEYLKDIYASGTHLLSLINDILDLSKIEAGRMELELSDFDLPTALDNALVLVRERAQRRSLTLDKEVDAGVGQISGDERKIRQVILNLLSNAIKFTPEGGRIEVGAVSKDGFVEVSVSDTGVGIAPEDHEAVFQEFRQVGTAEKKAEGTELGLTLCRKFIELHGGRILVKSQPGEGSTFTFTIPVRHGE